MIAPADVEGIEEQLERYGLTMTVDGDEELRFATIRVVSDGGSLRFEKMVPVGEVDDWVRFVGVTVSLL